MNLALPGNCYPNIFENNIHEIFVPAVGYPYSSIVWSWNFDQQWTLKKAASESSLWLDVRWFLTCKFQLHAFQENWKIESENVSNVNIGQQILSNSEKKLDFAHVQKLQILKMSVPEIKLIFHPFLPWKRQRTRGFLTLSGGIEMQNWGLKWVNKVKTSRFLNFTKYYKDTQFATYRKWILRSVRYSVEQKLLNSTYLRFNTLSANPTKWSNTLK